jgi:hypothetical protein
MATALDNGLTPNRFGLVGFGGGTGHIDGHSHLVNGGQFGTSAQFGTAIGSLLTNGGTEDGYSGITTALSYSFRSDTARNFILGFFVNFTVIFLKLRKNPEIQYFQLEHEKYCAV